MNLFGRSRSGRIKEISKLRMAVAQDTFVAPEHIAQSAPVTSVRKMDIGLKGRGEKEMFVHRL